MADQITSKKRKNYLSYLYDYYCIGSNESILIYRNNKYKTIFIDEYNEKTDKVLSLNSNNDIEFTKAILYKYESPERMKQCRCIGETHIISDNHKLININNTINKDGKVPQLGDKIHTLQNFKLPNSNNKFMYIDNREICKNVPYFKDNMNGSFSLCGKGIKIKKRYNIPNITYLDEDLSYLLGLFISEGHIIDDLNRKGRGFGVFFSLSINEENIAIDIVRIIKEKFNLEVTYIKYPQYNRISVRCLNKALSYIFRFLDMGMSALTKNIPDIIYKSTINNKLAFITGCFIGDGTFNKSRITLKSISKNLLYGIKILLSENNIISTICEYNSSNTKEFTSYSLSIYANHLSNLLLYLSKFNWKHYNNITYYLDNRKYIKKKNIVNNIINKIKFIDHENSYIYDLHTEYGNYLLGTIWSHNSGANARVFFNHVWVDDIITIQYNMNQNKAPIWGYASQLFDVVAKGQILINGNFTVAFKEVGYLTLINNEIKNLSSGKNKTKDEVLKYWLSKGKPIEKIIDELYMSGNDKDFEDLAEAMEDYVWGKLGVAGNKIVRPDEFDYKNSGASEGIDLRGFDIVLTFGDFADNAAEHTVKVINDVHITGESMILTPDGSPVGLNYTFFARNLDDQISNIWNIDPSKKPETKDRDFIDNHIDTTHPEDFEAIILEAWDKEGNRITSLTGKEFFSWIVAPKTQDIIATIAKTNLNHPVEIQTARTEIKKYLIDVMNCTDFDTWQNGYYKGLSTIKFDIKFLLGTSTEDVSSTDTKLEEDMG